ncbi:MAG: DUF3106 domain-containing protein [Oxalobacteraceae bacterium]|nr:DUF3106 domain-containing protein [Oxalobacteraceae bacterium]
MGHKITFIAIDRACALIVLTVVLSLPTFGPAAAQNTAAPSSGGAKSDWQALTAEQQQALEPLAADWYRLDFSHKKKWLEIGNKLPLMQPEERSRIQNRMREWIKLSPQQKYIARENYWLAKKIEPSQKNAHWQEYQQLSDEQKKRLAVTGTGKKNVPGVSIARKNNIVLSAKSRKIPPQSDPTDDKDSSTLTPSVQSDKK